MNLELSKLFDELEESTSISGLRNIKKLEAKGNYYRVRVGDYRLGFKIVGDDLHLLRFMHRKEIYKFFP